ncbi:hypothetical protein RUND412_008435 [Rhizina undulata]
MLSSIPTLTPRDAHSLWYQPSSTFTLSSSSHPLTHVPPSPTSQNVHPSGLHARQSRPRSTVITPLQQLALDEQSVAQRKLNIARFGSTWIRPPGVQKTLQGELDEKAEREEAEAQVLSEAGNEDTNINALLEDEVTGEDEDEEGGTEPDLDADIPEAEDLDEDDDDLEVDEEEDEEDDEVDLDANVPEADEAETSWDTESENAEPDSEEDDGEEDDEEGDEEDNGLDNEPQMPPPRAVREGSQGTESLGGTDSSPQYAMFSHDDHFGPQDGEEMDPRLRAYQRTRGALRGRVVAGRSEDEMEVDGDDA